jgi:Xaa-Pro aminopeptidase/Xaa-Pro dipeptidase
MSASAVAGRIGRLRTGLAERGLGGLLVSQPANVRYLSGFSGSNALLLVGAERAFFLTDGRYEEQAAKELAADVGFDLSLARDGILAAMVERVTPTFAGATIGFESSNLTYDQWQSLSEGASSVDWKAVAGMVESLRAVKDEEEVAALERAAEIAAQALCETLPLVEPGMSELEIAAELEYRMLGLGAERPAFETIVASGARTALPHAMTGRRAVREGNLLLCDFGVRWQGYHSDLTRTFVVGEPTRLQSARYELVLAAQRAAIDRLKPGVAGSDVDGAARRVFERDGVDSRFVHSTGHGLGLEVHEGPRLGRKSEERLRTNMVVTVEPGLYFPGWGGIRIEDDFVIGTDRPRSLVELEKHQFPSLPA